MAAPHPDVPWKAGFFSCCSDPATCCCSMIFPCFVHQQIVQTYEMMTNNPNPSTCGTLLCDMVSAFLIFWLPFRWANTRNKIRHKYDIEGSMTDDFLVSCCCVPCTLTQMKRELYLRRANVAPAPQAAPQHAQHPPPSQQPVHNNVAYTQPVVGQAHVVPQAAPQYPQIQAQHQQYMPPHTNQPYGYGNQGARQY
eukprot:Rmarinus@m.22608